MDRRTWLQLITILTAAREAHPQQRGGTTPPPAEGAGRGGRGQGGLQNLPMRITKDQVVGALKLHGAGVPGCRTRHDAARRQPGDLAATRRCARRTCRSIPSPPLHSIPGLPDRQPIKGPQRFDTTIPKTPAMKAPSNLEDVAFWRVVDLAPLVKSRAVSSTDLTKMYLARMQKYSPKLLCLITPTEELALQQAAAADQGDPRRALSRAAARDSVRAEGPVRHQGHSDHVRRGALPDARGG